MAAEEDSGVTNSNKKTPHRGVGSPERLWASHGLEDVYFQREAQVTWWTVLGGIAVAALLTKLDAIPTSVKAGQWYIILYYLATLLVIVNSWVQTVWGSLVLRWPISIPTSLFLFFQGISMSVAGLNVAAPAVWYGAISVVLITAVLNQVAFSRSRAWIALPEEMIARARIGIRIYLVISVFCVLATVLLALLSGTVIDFIFGFIAVIVSIAALTWQHFGMKEEKRRLQIP